MKFVKESLNEELFEDDVTSYLNKLFNPHGITVTKDFEEPGENYDYEDCKAYAQYSFSGNNSEDLSLEVLEDFDGNRSFQFWYDASPIITGDPMTLDPDHQPFNEIENFIPEVLEGLEEESFDNDEDEEDY